MNQRAATWGDVLDTRRGSSFVGRRSELEAFRLNCLYDVPQHLLFTVLGPPGIGKSTLLDQYRVVAREHGIVTAGVGQWDIRLTREFAAIQTMSALAGQLQTAGTPLTSFGEMLRDYQKTLQAIGEDEDAPGQAWSLLGGILDEDAWTAKMWDDYLFQAMPSRRSQLLQDPVAALTGQFVHDLNAWATVRKVVLFFDDWDEMPPYLDTWLLDVLRAGSLSMDVWLVLSSTKPLSRGWDDVGSATAVLDLEALSSSESRVLLLRRGVEENLSLDQRVALGLGHPMTLELLAATPGALSGSTGRSVVDRFLGAMPLDHRDNVLRCATARYLDAGVLSALFTDDEGGDTPRDGADAPHVRAKTEAMTAWLMRSPLVAPDGDGWRFRPGIYGDLARWARTHAPYTWRTAHRALYAYYRQQLELSQPASPYLDGAWQHSQSEALYHAMVADDGVAAMNAAYLGLTEVMGHFYPWAGTVVRVMRQATRFGVTDRRLVGWTDTAGAVLDALTARDYEEAVPLLDGVLAPGIWQPEVKQALRGIRQQAIARLGVAPETEVAVTLVDEGAPQPVDDSGEMGQEPVIAVSPESSGEPPASSDTTHEPAPVIAADGGSRQDDASDAASAATPPVAGAVEHCRYGNEQLATGAYEAAIEAYDQSLALDSDYVAALYNRGLAYARVGALDSAMRDFTRVVDLQDGQWRAYHQRGLVHARRGAFDRAVADYDRALAVQPDAAALIYDRANACFRLHAYERAIEDYTRVLSEMPDRVDAYLNLGLAHAALKDYPEALRSYNQAIARDPDRAVAYTHRGQAYVRLQRFAEALADYERALEINPRDAAVHNSRGLLYARIEAYEQAAESYRQAMALRPDWATPYYNAACAAALAGDAAQARVWLSRAVGLRERYRGMASNDADFAAIRDDPSFRAIVNGG